MNLSNIHRKPSVPFAFKQRFAIPRNCLKNLQKKILALQFTLRSPHQSVICALFLALVVLSFLLRPSLPHLSSKPLSDPSSHPYPITPGSAFSPEACDRMYDPAWTVFRDRGPVTSTKLRAEIAYFIQVGDDSVSLLQRLFARIHHPRNIYIIHIDAKVDPERRAEVAHLIHDSELYQRNIHIMHSEMVTYKAISMVINTISAMTLALEKHPTWDYFINLSGADYPLVSPEDQALLLARPCVPIGRLNFLSFFPKKEWLPYSFRVRNMHWDPAAAGLQSNRSKLFLMRGAKTNPLEPHRAYVFTKAEAWMILSRPFVRFVVRSGFAKRMLVNHMHILSVPEHYFADILYNHPVWRKTIVPDAFRKVVWYLRNRRSGQHPYVLDKGSSTFTFWEYIEETRSLFARKFSIPDSRVMDRIDAEMSGAALKETDARYRQFRKTRQAFLKRIIDHFDELTQKTLSQQGYQWPKSAYPSFRR